MKPVTLTRRLAMFNVVGVAGFVVQIASLWFLVRLLTVPVLPATALAVEAAVLHNFVFHVRWTWRDRPAGARETLLRLLRFNVSNGAVSIVANVLVMALLEGVCDLHYMLANAAGVACGSVVNFVLGDRVVFTRTMRPAAAPLQ